MSSIVLAELTFGVENSEYLDGNRRELDLFSARVAAVPFDATAAWHYGQIRAALRRAGTPVGPNDLLIGAHARSLGLTLVTNNRREFDRMPGLKVENWT
jgi:tRNA(fMet)-specific endonuclease VapC